MLQQASGRGLSGVVTLAVDEARVEAVEQETPNGPGKMLEYVPRGVFFLKSRPVSPPKARLLETEEEASQLLQVPSGV